jgi:hypothetical protein
MEPATQERRKIFRAVIHSQPIVTDEPPTTNNRKRQPYGVQWKISAGRILNS